LLLRNQGRFFGFPCSANEQVYESWEGAYSGI